MRTTSHSAGSTYIDEYRAPVAGEMEVISEPVLPGIAHPQPAAVISVPRRTTCSGFVQTLRALLARSRWIIKSDASVWLRAQLADWSGTKRLMYMLSELTRDQIHRGVVGWPFTVRRPGRAGEQDWYQHKDVPGIDEQERGMVSVQRGRLSLPRRRFSASTTQ